MEVGKKIRYPNYHLLKLKTTLTVRHNGFRVQKQKSGFVASRKLEKQRVYKLFVYIALLSADPYPNEPVSA